MSDVDDAVRQILEEGICDRMQTKTKAERLREILEQVPEPESDD